MEALLKNLRINYFETGSGKPLLVLHGWGSNAERWRQVAEILGKKGYRVFVPDLPGFGKSQEPDAVWGLDEYVLFVNDFAETLGLDKFFLLGHSFGGALACKFALKYPQKIEKLFLVAAACIREKTQKKKILKVLSFFKFVPFARRFFYRFVLKSDYPETKGIMREIFLKVIKDDLSEELSKINLPTVIVWGDKDGVTPLWQGRLINSKIKNSELFVIERQNHALQITVPEELCSYF